MYFRFNNNGTEALFHTDETGYVYQHDTGNSFDGSNVEAEFQTPDMDYGDNGLRKSLYKVKLILNLKEHKTI